MKQSHKIFYSVLILLLAIILGGNSILDTRLNVFFIGVLLFLVHMASNKNIQNSMIRILVIWLVINVLSVVILGGGFIFFRIIIMTVNLILVPYLFLRAMGPGFWDKLEKVIFILTLLSIPLYLLNILFIDFFNSLTIYFEPLTKHSLTVNLHYWTALIYTNAIGDNYYGLVRNSGFVWEPGGFAMIIIVAIVYNWLTNGVSFNRKIFIYIVALISTFSTAGYFALLFILAAFYIKKVTFFNIILLGIAVIIFFNFVYQLDFMEGKINKYTEAYQQNEINAKAEKNKVKVNRFQGGYEALVKTMKYPLGYGLVSEKDYTDEVEIYGTNGLGSLLVMWGIPAFIYLIYLMWKFFVILNIRNLNRLSLFFLMMALLVVFFSNPIARYILPYLIIITPLAFKKYEIDHYFLAYRKTE